MILDAPIENQRTDQEDSIINKMLNLSKVQDHTLSKSKKLVMATQYIPFDLDDKQPRPSSHKNPQSRASAPHTGVNAKFICRNWNKFSSTASKKLKAPGGRAGGRGSE